MPSKRPKSNQQIRTAYQRGATITAISRSAKLSYHQVRDILLDGGVELREFPSQRVALTQIGKNLRRLRHEVGLSQKELAVRAGYKSREGAVISRIERGHRPDPKLPVLRRIATVLGSTVATLLKGE